MELSAGGRLTETSSGKHGRWKDSYDLWQHGLGVVCRDAYCEVFYTHEKWPICIQGICIDRMTDDSQVSLDVNSRLVVADCWPFENGSLGDRSEWKHRLDSST